MDRPTHGCRVACAGLLALTLGGSLAVQAAEPVDVELVLAVDVSLSMSPNELEIQRAGYAAALTDDSVIQAIQSGAHGKIAVTYFEWAGTTSQTMIVPWTVIASKADAQKIAKQLTANPPNSARRTSISAALEYGADLFAESGFSAPKRVIDISGDGPNNQGAPIVETREELLKQGITINGLPLMTNGGLNSAYDVEDLDRYYEKCVIGGPGAFMVPVNDWSQFPDAIRRKLVLELAANPVVAIPVQWTSEQGTPSGQAPSLLQPDGSYDCLIGEKLWRNRSWMWDQN